MHNKLFLTIRGNLGNQLFQFFAAYKLKEKYNFKSLKIYFESEHGDKINHILPYEVITKKEYYDAMGLLRRLIYNIGHSGRKLLQLSPFSFDNHKFKKIRFKAYSLFGIIEYKFLDFIDIRVSKFTKNIFMRGFFESRLYFEDLFPKERIRQLLFKDFHNKNLFQFNNTVCISVRRGDFLTAPSFMVCSLEYYKKAIAIIKEKLNSPIFMFFSNDIVWVKEHFKDMDNAFFEKGDSCPLVILKQISDCNHFILSNSTFAWWGWYLSRDTKNQIVISPNTWKNSYLDEHLIENSWLRIKCIDSFNYQKTN